MTEESMLWQPGEIPAGLLEALRATRQPLILTHIYPDGDALGSSVAMHRSLSQMGARPRTILTHAVPDKLRFIDHDGVAEVLDGKPDAAQLAVIEAADLIIVLDTSALDRLGHMREPVESTGTPLVCIDHHLEGDFDCFQEIWCEPGSPATGNLVLELIRALGEPLPLKSAESLFVAIATDTGWFRYSNSGSIAYRIAAELVESGVDPEPIFQKIFQSFSLERTLALGDLLAGVRCHHDGKILFSLLSEKMRTLRGVKMEDLDGFVDTLGQVAGTEIVFLIVEVGAERYKVSLRSRGDLSVHTIASRFGGGGHAKASGCRIEGPEEVVIAKLLEVCEEILDGHDSGS